MEEQKKSKDFIRTIIENDLKTNKHGSRVQTRFPPEPNGYLHIGHAKSICLNFGVAAEYNGKCNLRFDDTNPAKEEVEYVESIKDDIKWLGFDWEDRLFYASDYFEKLHNYAVKLIKMGKAYVCGLSQEEIREYRGTLTRPGKNSPYRDRTVEENLELFEKMRKGELKEGEAVLRAKIDMSSPIISMRDPAIYRIKHEKHHKTGDKWCIYPMYDFAHCLSDSIENITHSLCTLEFENNRPLYDWILNTLETENHPQQIEFARLNLTNTVMSKRKLLALVKENHVRGWDDPRMPTLAGLRRRGYTPEAIRDFCYRIGLAKSDSTVDYSMLEYCIREDLNIAAPRTMAVLRPLRLVIDNYPENQVEEMEAVNNPEKPEMGKRKIPFSRVLYIEQEDFLEDPPKKYFRLSPGKEVRLKYAYIIKCENIIKDDITGEIIEVHCTYYPETKSGSDQSGRKVKGTIHWISAEHSIEAEIRLYDHLFKNPEPDSEESGSGLENLNPDSLEILETSRIEPTLKNEDPGLKYQFERQGYFCVDPDSTKTKMVFNRTVTLRDTWAKIQKQENQK